MLVRLIDVVLILLFGFISISSVERRSPVRLPESNTSAPARVLRGNEANVTVLRDEARASHDAPRRYRVSLAKGVEVEVVGRAELTGELSRLAERSRGLQRQLGPEITEMRVNLRIDREDRVASAFDAYDAARDLGLPTRVLVRVPQASGGGVGHDGIAMGDLSGTSAEWGRGQGGKP